ncbi:MAG: SsrA-binding protein SmpB [Flavobacteriales bacterium]|nr:SsrA-binding protein SmpB [Flavobacteriales bacterium]
MKTKSPFKTDIKIKNKGASYEYELLDKFTAGIKLFGSEIKSIRLGKASINEAYIIVMKDEVFIRNMHIAEYDSANQFNHETNRDRKLLLKKQEIEKIEKHLQNKGLTAIPTLLFLNEKGLAKLNMAVAKGKKLYDKRESLKQKDTERTLNRKDLDS